ncbi:Serine/threonine-protein kinase Pkn1 [Listeria grayi]|uniref:Serine/threonine-protein kinase n=1 Tax=Listeria grayi FSL F6-1183 TaxID=1265827 RepID=A0A829R2U5_LISGR|nr:protein kinase [Listeria grayi]EUJ26007.1 serine/threonine-protein kinase [Listeria grayi FSL F6-1183]VEI36538.1 Serine/threonine-protein kinase Pkn1 [Listeria grayi]
MNFADVIKNAMDEIGLDENYQIKSNPRRGQSRTFTILNSEEKPIYIIKFFNYLDKLMEDIGLVNIKKYKTLDELIDNLDEIESIQYQSETIVERILFHRKCFNRYVNACAIESLDCFPSLYYHEKEIYMEESFFGFLIEDFVDGETLEKVIEKIDVESRLKYTVDFIFQLAEIISKLKTHGIVHRDISPDNIMCMNGKYIVIDPGIIKMDDENQATQSMMRMGKLLYMSPEQYFGNSKNATFKSDLYAVGIIALEIILGFNPLETIMITCNNRTAPHEEVLKKYSREYEDDYYRIVEETDSNEQIWRIIYKLIQIEDRNRFESVDAFIDSMKSIEGGL